MVSSRFSGLALFLVLSCFSLSAANVACNDFSGPVAIAGVDPGISFDCGTPLTFSGFINVAAAGNPNPQINLVNAFSDTSTSSVTLNFNPNMVNIGGPPEDQWLFFYVDGPLRSIGLAVGGVNAVVQEVACLEAIGPDMPVCDSGDVIANMLAFSPPFGNTSNVLLTRVGDRTYIGKDIAVYSNYLQEGGGALTVMSQIFGYAGRPDDHSAVPEPSTYLMLGGGLIGIAWRRRKTFTK
jgi:hypothetical protein